MSKSLSAEHPSARTYTLPLPKGEFGAYLFDCDGTVVDSMPLHYKAWRHILDGYNCPFPEEQFYAWGGMPIREILDTLNRMHGLAMPVEQLSTIKEQHYYARLHELEPVHEVVEHIEAAHGHVPFAIVSGSTRDSVVKSLEQLGLLDRFDVLVCAGDYIKAKPDPEPFLLAAEKLGIPPAKCLVFEDTEMGVNAAKAAGMSWIKVPQPHER
jgi:HAD superfamily hydrolase (TIGR01509 family)